VLHHHAAQALASEGFVYPHETNLGLLRGIIVKAGHGDECGAGLIPDRTMRGGVIIVRLICGGRLVPGLAQGTVAKQVIGFQLLWSPGADERKVRF
jgi:sorbitol-specific phosphotransferase system component IIBC